VTTAAPLVLVAGPSGLELGADDHGTHAVQPARDLVARARSGNMMNRALDLPGRHERMERGAEAAVPDVGTPFAAGAGQGRQRFGHWQEVRGDQDKR
jgi:hypothetical protein